MSFTSSNMPKAGAASNAEPSMEEILASIRRILKEDEGVRTPPAAMATGDDDVLVLDESMMMSKPEVLVEDKAVEAAPATPTATPMPPILSAPPPEAAPMRYAAQPPAREIFAGSSAAVQSSVVLPATEPAPIFSKAGQVHVASEATPFSTKYVPLPETSEDSVVLPAKAQAAEEVETVDTHEIPDRREAATLPPPLPPAPKLEPKMSESGKSQSLKSDSIEPPDSLISDETSNAAANSIGALVRSMTQEKAVTVARHGMTIEDIVRDEIRPLLKSWMDTNLPSLVERVVRTEIERVINRGEN